METRAVAAAVVVLSLGRAVRDFRVETVETLSTRLVVVETLAAVVVRGLTDQTPYRETLVLVALGVVVL